MAFLKQGTPIPFTIVASRCSECGKETDQLIVDSNGKSVCHECLNKNEKS